MITPLKEINNTRGKYKVTIMSIVLFIIPIMAIMVLVALSTYCLVTTSSGYVERTEAYNTVLDMEYECETEKNGVFNHQTLNCMQMFTEVEMGI